MEAGHPGRHGDSVAQPAVQASSCASVLVTTPHLATVAVCVSGLAGMKGTSLFVSQRQQFMLLITRDLQGFTQPGARVHQWTLKSSLWSGVCSPHGPALEQRWS